MIGSQTYLNGSMAFPTTTLSPLTSPASGPAGGGVHRRKRCKEDKAGTGEANPLNFVIMTSAAKD